MTEFWNAHVKSDSRVCKCLVTGLLMQWAIVQHFANTLTLWFIHIFVTVFLESLFLYLRSLRFPLRSLLCC